MLTAIGVAMIIAGILAIIWGDKALQVRGGIILKLFDSRSHSDDACGNFANWPYKLMFGGALIFAGVMMVLKDTQLL